MVSLKELQLGKWYQAQNRIFMPIKKINETQVSNAFGREPDYILNIVYLQPVEHMNIFIFGYMQWEVNIEENRQYLFHVISEDTIEIEDIKKPTIFNKVFIGLFDYKWQIHGDLSYLSPGDKRGVEELKDIINTIRRT
jgi:hypothetical protein